MVLRQRLTKHTTPSTSLDPPHDDKEELRLSLSSVSSYEEEGEQELKSSSLDDGSHKEEEHQVDDVAREQHDVFNLVALVGTMYNLTVQLCSIFSEISLTYSMLRVLLLLDLCIGIDSNGLGCPQTKSCWVILLLKLGGTSY